jgi:tRNA nucleotidyltransferase/poly(A) polymerase
MQTPSVKSLPAELRELGQEVARRLASAGYRGWIVGGSVRDLALGRVPRDVDMACAAAPEQIAALFPTALGVGRAFGTMLVRDRRGDVELTTFRGEGTYSDGRRPDQVQFGVSLEQDARRRDFTCNALYLDPLTDEVRDPTGGLGDLARGELRAVGEARERFAEDGLRLLRFARIAAQYDLSVGEGLRAAARSEARRLERISGERVREELAKLLSRPGSAVGARLLTECGLLGVRFPSLADPGVAARRLAVLGHLGEEPGEVLGLAALLGPPGDPAEVESLRPSRELQRRLHALWQAAAKSLEPVERAPWLRMLREGDEGELLRYLAALAAVDPRQAAAVREVQRLAAEVPLAARRPVPLLTPADLAAAGIPRGPRWGELQRELEDLQLEGRLSGRAAALAWLDGRK